MPVAKKKSTNKTTARKKTAKTKTTKKTSTRKKSSFGNASSGSHLAYGAFSDFKFNKRTSSFGKLTVPTGMRPVSDFRKTRRPFTIMPFGPSGRWLENGHAGAGSSGAPMQFGSDSLKGRTVNPSGYLSTWNGQPRIIPPSWNPLLLQGNNTFREGVNSPKLSNVVVPSGPMANSFGRYHPVTPRNMTSFGKRGGMVANQGARKSKGWAKTARKIDRGSLPKRCFLGSGMRYPVCNDDEQFDCRGILAAIQRSKKGSKVRKSAVRKGKDLGCAWASKYA